MTTFPKNFTSYRYNFAVRTDILGEFKVFMSEVHSSTLNPDSYLASKR